MCGYICVYFTWLGFKWLWLGVVHIFMIFEKVMVWMVMGYGYGLVMDYG